MPNTEENGLYSRQRELSLYYPQNITVVGCGGIGSWVAIFAAMSGVGTIFLYDQDIMEESNRNRLPFCQGSINRPKVDVVADFIRGIRPGTTVIPIKSRLDETTAKIQITTGCYVMLDCTDSPKTQIMLYNLCKNYGTRYIRAGYDGTRIMVTSVVSGWIKKDADEEPYEVNPSWVVPAAVVAALAVGKMMKFHDQEVGLDLSEIGIPVLEKQKRITARCYQAPKDELGEAGRLRRRRARTTE